MPEPTERVRHESEGFDPDLHCGASTRARSTCMNRAGFKTEHFGQGRCFRHGGKGGGKINGVEAKAMRITIDERVAQAKNDPNLLVMDEEIAMARVMWQLQFEHFSQEYEQFAEIMEQIDAGLFDDVPEDKRPKLTVPGMDVKPLEVLNKLIKNGFEMSYARRHSIPMTELEGVMGQIGQLFEAVADEYGLPNQAKIDFVEGIGGIKVSRPRDPQQAYVPRNVVDEEPTEGSETIALIAEPV